MSKLRVSIHGHANRVDDQFALEALDIATALTIADINVGILYLFAISSLGVYGIIMAGWASNSKYAFVINPPS